MKSQMLLLGLLLGCAAAAWGVVPALINFQGTLTDSTGTPLASGLYTIEFRVWNKPIAGEPDEQLVWGRTYEVPVANGRFNVILGGDSGTVIEGAAVNDIAYAFAEPERYVGITPTHVDGTPIATVTELAPRQRVLSAPYALRADTALNGNPPGTVLAYAGSTVPNGYMICNGDPLEKAAYPGLWEAIGHTWTYFADNPDTGVTRDTHFQVPNLMGRTLIHSSYTAPIRTLGESGGATKVELQVSELPDHTHTFNDSFLGSGEPGSFWVGGDHYYWWGSYDNEESTTGTTNAAGAAHENMPPFAVVNYIIKY